MDFVNFKDHGGIMARLFRIIVCRCLLEILNVENTIWLVNISNTENVLSIYPHCTIQNLLVSKCVLKEMKKLRSCIGLCIYPYFVPLLKGHVYSFNDPYTCFTLMPHINLIMMVLVKFKNHFLIPKWKAFQTLI
jgi:hypothetical protein